MFKYTLFGSIYRWLFKPVFFRFDPERVHDFILLVGNLLGSMRLTRWGVRRLLRYEHPMLRQNIAGVEFANPVGLAAGFDKNAKLVNILPHVGFGAVEVGSITLEAYAGNPPPRLFRLPRSRALVVYYGLMNDGVSKIVDRLKRYPQPKAAVGISVAKTNCVRTAAMDSGIKDYCDTLSYLERSNVGDWYTINISCPNTFGGEPFTTKERLTALLGEIKKLNIHKPIFLKLPINLPLAEFDGLLRVAVSHKVTGIIIGNLTKTRDPQLIHDDIPEHVTGGISGLPTQKLSNDLISYTYQHYGMQLVIIGVGGIFSAADAYEKIKRGASLVQLITGMIYQGPQLVGEINAGLVKLLQKDGYKKLGDAVGVA